MLVILILVNNLMHIKPAIITTPVYLFKGFDCQIYAIKTLLSIIFLKQKTIKT